eukprot:637951-Karenia_brevis.AAC.1
MTRDVQLQPIYLSLDERRRRSEHYDARVRSSGLTGAGNAACDHFQADAKSSSSIPTEIPRTGVVSKNENCTKNLSTKVALSRS